MVKQQNNLYPLIQYFEFINKDLEMYKHLGVVKETNEDTPSFIGLLYQMRALLIAKKPQVAINILLEKYPTGLPPYGGVLRSVLLFYNEHPDLNYEDDLNKETPALQQDNSPQTSAINDKQYCELLNKLENISSAQFEQNISLNKLQEPKNEIETPALIFNELNTNVEALTKQFTELRTDLLSVHNNMLETKKIAKESLDGVDTKFRNYSDAFSQTVKEVPRLVEQSQISLFRNILSKEIEEMTTAVNAFMKKYDQIYLTIDHKMQQNIEKNNLLIQQSIDVQREKIITHFATASKKFLILITSVSIIAAAGIGFVSAKYVEHSFISTLSDVANAAKNKN